MTKICDHPIRSVDMVMYSCFRVKFVFKRGSGLVFVRVTDCGSHLYNLQFRVGFLTNSLKMIFLLHPSSLMKTTCRPSNVMSNVIQSQTETSKTRPLSIFMLLHWEWTLSWSLRLNLLLFKGIGIPFWKNSSRASWFISYRGSVCFSNLIKKDLLC